MADEQIARPSLALFKLPCGSTAVRPVRGHASAVASLRPDVFVPVRRLRTRRPIANRTRAFRWTARRASGTLDWPPGPACACDQPAICAAVGVVLGSRSRLLNAAAKQAEFCDFCKHRSPPVPLSAVGRALAAIAYEGSFTIAQPLQPRPALIGRGVSGRTGRPRTPKAACYYPSCYCPCAFRRVPSFAWRKYRVIERCAGYGANTARLAAFMLYPLAHQCGNDVACRLPRSFPSFENPASSGPPRCGLFACRAAHVASFVLSFQHAAVGRCATCAVEVIGAASEAAMCAM